MKENTDSKEEYHGHRSGGVSPLTGVLVGSGVTTDPGSHHVVRVFAT